MNHLTAAKITGLINVAEAAQALVGIVETTEDPNGRNWQRILVGASGVNSYLAGLADAGWPVDDEGLLRFSEDEPDPKPDPAALRDYLAGCHNLRFEHWHDAYGPVSPLDPRVKQLEANHA